MANLDYRSLQHGCLVLLLLLGLALASCLALVLVDEGHWASLVDVLGGSDQRVLCDQSDLLDHAFERVQDEALGILGEQDGADREDDDDEQGSRNLDDSFGALSGLGTVCDREGSPIFGGDRVPAQFLLPQSGPLRFPFFDEGLAVPGWLVRVCGVDVYQWVDLVFTPCCLDQVIVGDSVVRPRCLTVVVYHLEMLDRLVMQSDGVAEVSLHRECRKAKEKTEDEDDDGLGRLV